MSRAPAWTASVRLTLDRSEVARWLEEALAPEARREVPRARSTLLRKGRTVELRVDAADAGAMRAALNTYLGWVALALSTVRAAEESPAGASAGEAVISRPS